MAIFNSKKKKIDNTEFIRDPEYFIEFIREEDDELVQFGQTSLVAAGAEVIKPLLALITNEQEEVKIRRRAGIVLGKIGEPAITSLLEVLKEQNLKSRFSGETIGMLAAALGGIGKQAVEPLILALGSELRHVRFGAAIALVQIGDAKSMDAVRNAASHGDIRNQEMFKMVLLKYTS